jgi:hypothetical protein
MENQDGQQFDDGLQQEAFLSVGKSESLPNFGMLFSEWKASQGMPVMVNKNRTLS